MQKYRFRKQRGRNLSYIRKQESLLTGKLASLDELEKQLVNLIAYVGVGRTLELIAKQFPALVKQLTGDTEQLPHLIRNITNKQKESVMKQEDRNQSGLGKDFPQSHICSLDSQDLKDVGKWGAVLEIIQEQISKPSFDTWLKNTTAKYLDDETIVVFADNQFQKDWLEDRYKEIIFFAVKRVLGTTYEIEFSI